MALRQRTDLWRRATDVIGGVNSPVRAMRAVGMDEPVFMARGEGPWIEDVDGTRYVDWVQSWGANSSSATPIRRRSRPCTGCGSPGRPSRAPTRAEVGLAAEIVDAVPSIEMSAAGRLGHRGLDEHASARARGDAARPRDHVRQAVTTATSTPSSRAQGRV